MTYRTETEADRERLAAKQFAETLAHELFRGIQNGSFPDRDAVARLLRERISKIEARGVTPIPA
jgi:hypothetical protein